MSRKGRGRSQGRSQKKSSRGKPSRGGRNARVREEKTRANTFSAPQAAARTAKRIKDFLDQGREIAAQPREEVLSPFEQLDPWQREAVDSLLRGENVVVDAPTTAGKTRVVECFFETHLGDPGFRAAYTTPVKSLSNDKFREFRDLYGAENVGIATGDIKENLKAPIVVATLETYRNSLLGTEPDLGRNLVVFDEYHYVQDSSRGSSWEEALILTPSSCQLLLLSASVDNGSQFCAWLNKIHQKTSRMIVVKERPVPLTSLIHTQDKWLAIEDIPLPMRKRFDEKRLRMPLPIVKIAEQMPKVEELALTPCILYSGRRLGCENLAIAIAGKLQKMDELWREKIKKKISESRYLEIGLELMPPRLKGILLNYGVAYHHSGLSPNTRIVIETLLKDGDLKFCTATMGLSLGINFSVRSAMITDYRRPDEEGFVFYSPSEVLQMLGRAGRRGKDVVGFSLWPSLEAFHKLGKTKRKPCYSQLKNDPTTFLGLVGRGYDLEAVERFYSRSFKRFQDQSADLSLVTAKRVVKKLEKEIPCSSPAFEFMNHYKDDHKSLCEGCELFKPCHKFIKTKAQADVAALHLHLYGIGALDKDNHLTQYGEIARFFPQAGGLLLADLIDKKKIDEKNLLACIQLIAAMALAHYKKPSVPENYEFPFDVEWVEQELLFFYPEILFPEVYDSRPSDVNKLQLRDWNPGAGYVVKQWLTGCSFKELCREVCSETFKDGDAMNLMYRISTYLQSISGVDNKDLMQVTRAMREELLREPISVVVS